MNIGRCPFAELVLSGDSPDGQRDGRRVSGEAAQHYPRVTPPSEGATAREFVWT